MRGLFRRTILLLLGSEPGRWVLSGLLLLMGAFFLLGGVVGGAKDALALLIGKIQEYGRLYKEGKALGCVFNAGAFTHTSVALHDAIKGVDGLPVIECHISNVHAREAFRHHSYISPASAGIVVGFGVQGYVIALEGLVRTQDKDNPQLR